jgi:transcriptional regulator of arginine metabolism
MAGAQVGRKIDCANPRSANPVHPLPRGTVRKSAEHQLRLLERCVVGRNHHDRASVNQDLLAASLICSGKAERKPRVSTNQSAKLSPCVATCAEDADRNSMHAECILLHSPAVNGVVAPAACGFRRGALAMQRATSGAISRNEADGHHAPRTSKTAYDLAWRQLSSRRKLAEVSDIVQKKQRHRLILEIVESKPVPSQEELRRLLNDRGLQVTQSTLSRDLRELRLARIPSPSGVRYASPDAATDDARAMLDDVLPQFFATMDGVRELLVLKTLPGGAQPIAEALDFEGFSDVLGTLGGENTVLVICRSVGARERLERRIQRLTRKGG